MKYEDNHLITSHDENNLSLHHSRAKKWYCNASKVYWNVCNHYLPRSWSYYNYAAINFGSAIRIDLEFESIFNLDENNLNEKKTFFSKGQFSSILFEISPFIGTGCKNSLRIFSSFFHTALNWFFSPLAEFLNFFHTDMISRDFSSKFKFFDWLFWFWDFSAETNILR